MIEYCWDIQMERMQLIEKTWFDLDRPEKVGFGLALPRARRG